MFVVFVQKVYNVATRESVMKNIISAVFVSLLVITAANADFKCGAGYVLGTHSKIDGINAAECQKLWCRDLETGKAMGNGKNPASGYKSTSMPHEVCSGNTCVECFGERKWCSGEPAGVWSPEYGVYTRGGGDTAAYQSYQKGSCFAWRLDKPNCPDGQSAIAQGGKWVCVTASGTGTDVASHASSIRRTGTLRRGR